MSENTVYFRSFEPEDAELIYKWMNDDSLKQYSYGLNKRICREEAVEWVKSRMFQKPYEVWWAICAVDTDVMIGYMSLNDIHFINRSADFGGIVIADNNYRDGTAWIESYLFLLEYGFERLNLNRLSGGQVAMHPLSTTIGGCLFFQREGILRQAIYKNGVYHDVIMGSLLASEYYAHKEKGDYQFSAVLKRIIRTMKENKKLTQPNS